jgi:predicted ABC-type ATPase
MPVVYVIGGPNGAGKTTLAREFLPDVSTVEFLNVDLLAAGLSPLQPELMAVRAARLLLQRWRELVAARVNFAFESTLSGRTYAAMLRAARDAGYSVHLCYLWLPDVKLSLRRVRQRVRRGGHNVPEADVRRRFSPSLLNFFELYLPLAHEALLLNGGTRPPKRIARWSGSNRVEEVPESEFAEMAFKALVRAQRVAARENARWAMKLIVQETRPARRKPASKRRAIMTSSSGSAG